jgi:acyl-CoA oxidase
MNHYQVEFLIVSQYIVYTGMRLGVELGEIGTLFGPGLGDNGYLRLTNVRIPRTQMLMKLAQVMFIFRNKIMYAVFFCTGR